MIYSLFKSFFNSIGRTLGRIFVYILIAVLLIFFSSYINIADVYAEATEEGFWSKVVLGKFANGDWQVVNSKTSNTNELLLNDIYEYYYYPVWLGFYGTVKNEFSKDKIYNLSFTVHYPNSSTSSGAMFNWQKAMQYAKMEVTIDNAVVNYCTMVTNTSSSSQFTCEFTFSQTGGSYYEIDVAWWDTNLSNLNLGYGLLDSVPTLLSFDLQLVSNTDYGGQLVTQNEVIIGQNQQIIDATNETNNKLENINDTNKGIWQSIKELPNKFMEMLKGLFIPEDGYFDDWFNDLKTFFEDKLGFLATPFTIFIDFINMYLALDASTDIIIDIPDITVPNFEEHKIISAQTFNWSQLLRSKESLNALWQLYLSFIDVYLILNFIGLCESKYNRIFGGDTSTYEYYTVEDSVSYDGQTGEVTSRRQNERTTTKRKV